MANENDTKAKPAPELPLSVVHKDAWPKGREIPPGVAVLDAEQFRAVAIAGEFGDPAQSGNGLSIKCLDLSGLKAAQKQAVTDVFFPPTPLEKAVR